MRGKNVNSTASKQVPWEWSERLCIKMRFVEAVEPNLLHKLHTLPVNVNVFLPGSRALSTEVDNSKRSTQRRGNPGRRDMVAILLELQHVSMRSNVSGSGDVARP